MAQNHIKTVKPGKTAPSIGRNDPNRPSTCCADGQTLDVFEGASGMSADLALSVVQRGFGKCHGGGAMYQAAFAGELAAVARGWPHEAGFHLDGDNAHVGLHTARSSGHGHVHQRHAGPAVRHAKGVEVLGQ